MRVIRVTPAGRRPSAEAYPQTATARLPANSIFIGEVDAQTIIDKESRDLRLLEVVFKDGARNRLHTHTTDQILVITEGKGLVGTRDEQHEVEPGDVALIPAGEAHWHGARPGHDMTHLSVTGQGRTEVVEQAT